MSGHSEAIRPVNTKHVLPYVVMSCSIMHVENPVRSKQMHIIFLHWHGLGMKVVPVPRVGL
jgi:hypothetical protein